MVVVVVLLSKMCPIYVMFDVSPSSYCCQRNFPAGDNRVVLNCIVLYYIV